MILHPKLIRRRAEELKRKYSVLLDTDRELALQVWDAAKLLDDIAMLMEDQLYSAEDEEAKRILDWLGMGETVLTEEQDVELTRQMARYG